MKVHEFDQIQAALRDIAKLSKEYHNQLVDVGFSKKEALTLTATWSAQIMLGNNK